MPLPSYPLSEPRFYSGNPGNTGNVGPLGSGYLDNTRRLYDFSDMVAELHVQDSPFLSYLMNMRKNPCNDINFKFLEERHQWQRQHFTIKTAVSAQNVVTSSAAITGNNFLNNVQVTCKIDEYGRVRAGDQKPIFMIPGNVISIVAKVTGGSAFPRYTGASSDVMAQFRITGTGTHGTDHAKVNLDLVSIDNIALSETGSYPTGANSTLTLELEAGAKGTVIGSAYGEGTKGVPGWSDSLFDRQGWMQIFKTSCDLYSGTQLSMEYRGYRNEFQRNWARTIKEHKLKITRAFLFGQGRYENKTSGTDTSKPVRYTWGIIPFITRFGETQSFNYSSSTYDDFVDFMKDFIEPTKGMMEDNVLMHVSRKTMNWFHKLKDNTFIHNTIDAAAGDISWNAKLGVSQMMGTFGHRITKISTAWGDINLVVEENLRNEWEDTAFIQTLNHLEYRPLQGNGISRDGFVRTNVQDPGMDGRRDEIITEAGLSIHLPETHCVVTFS